MSVLKVRFPKILIVLGFTLLLVSHIIDYSSTIGFGYGPSHDIEDDGVIGYMFKAQNNIFVSAWERDGHRFSLYIYYLNTTATVIELQIPQNVTALVIAENITSFEEIVMIPANAIYLIYVAPTDTLPITVRVKVTAAGLQFTVALFGMINIGIGVIILVVHEILPIFLARPKEGGVDGNV